MPPQSHNDKSYSKTSFTTHNESLSTKREIKLKDLSVFKPTDNANNFTYSTHVTFFCFDTPQKQITRGEFRATTPMLATKVWALKVASTLILMNPIVGTTHVGE